MRSATGYAQPPNARGTGPLTGVPRPGQPRRAAGSPAGGARSPGTALPRGPPRAGRRSRTREASSSCPGHVGSPPVHRHDHQAGSARRAPEAAGPAERRPDRRFLRTRPTIAPAPVGGRPTRSRVGSRRPARARGPARPAGLRPSAGARRCWRSRTTWRSPSRSRPRRATAVWWKPPSARPGPAVVRSADRSDRCRRNTATRIEMGASTSMVVRPPGPCPRPVAGEGEDE